MLGAVRCKVFCKDSGLSGISGVHKKEHYPEFSESIKKIPYEKLPR